MKFKNAAEMKWFLYVSKSKLQMLFSQIGRQDKSKRTLQWKLTIGAAFVSRASEAEESVDDDDMLKTVLPELEASGQVGTIFEPNEYIKGVMPMRWGIYDDSGAHDPTDGPLVYFGGLDAEQQILVGLGGSSKHVTGYEGATSTHSRSNTPALVNSLILGMESGKREVPFREDERQGEAEVYQAMAIAQHYLRPPTQNLEFFAKTLMVGKVHHVGAYIGIPQTKVILGTPLYVALAAPYPKDDHWGIIPE